MFLTDGGLLLGMGPNSKGPYLVSFHVILKKKNSIGVIHSNVVLKSYEDIHFGNFKCLQHFFKNIYKTNQSILNVQGCLYKSYIKQYFSKKSKNATAAFLQHFFQAAFTKLQHYETSPSWIALCGYNLPTKKR